jgi:hypothetical protein
MNNETKSQNLLKWTFYLSFRTVLVLLLVFFSCTTIWTQVYTPSGVVLPSTNPTTNNLGVNNNTPNANIGIFHTIPPIGLSVPALRIRSNNYYLPAGEYLPGDPRNCPPQSNIIEIDTEFGLPACVSPLPIIPAPIPSRRLMTLTEDGNLGLNILNPRTILHLNNTNRVNDILSLSYAEDGEDWNYLNIGHNYLSFNAKLENSFWRVDDGSYMANSFRMTHGWGGLDFDFYNHPTNQQGAATQTWTPFIGDWKTAMRINWNGNIKMGNLSVISGAHQNNKLSVDGKIVAKEVVITNGPEWGDYVFEKDYKLLPLEDLEKFIKSNHHLPDIPTAKKIAENGIDVSELISKQMVKIEELTLYLIEQKKEIDDLKKAMNSILENTTSIKNEK